MNTNRLQQQQMETLKTMFQGRDINESILFDVFAANKNQLGPTVEVLLDMTKDPEEDRREAGKRRADSSLKEDGGVGSAPRPLDERVPSVGSNKKEKIRVDVKEKNHVAPREVAEGILIHLSSDDHPKQASPPSPVAVESSIVNHGTARDAPPLTGRHPEDQFLEEIRYKKEESTSQSKGTEIRIANQSIFTANSYDQTTPNNTSDTPKKDNQHGVTLQHDRLSSTSVPVSSPSAGAMKYFRSAPTDKNSIPPAMKEPVNHNKGGGLTFPDHPPHLPQVPIGYSTQNAGKYQEEPTKYQEQPKQNIYPSLEIPTTGTASYSNPSLPAATTSQEDSKGSIRANHTNFDNGVSDRPVLVSPSVVRLQETLASVPPLPPSSVNHGGIESPSSHRQLFEGVKALIPASIKKVFQGGVDPLQESILNEKGLINGIGENNCFLNVVIQSLWHLKSFVKKFSTHQEHSHPPGVEPNSCPFCALKVLFVQFEFSEEFQLPPTALREAMSVLFRGQSRFQLGQIDDAAEVHDALLSCLHNAIVGGKDLICNPSCIVHRTFCMNLIEYMKCECGTTSKPFLFQEFIHYVSADALRKHANQSMTVTPDGSVTCSLSFSEVIKRVHHSDVRPCKNDQCSRQSHMKYGLSASPSVISIGIAWSSDSPGVDFIYEILDLIDETLILSEIFDLVLDDTKKSYRFKGMISYYGKHYNAYFKNSSNKEWVVFDDTTVKKVGSKWSDVVARCRDGRYQPFILWFEEENI
eukprot:TRINITY_DN1591_c0_g1_i3.p1 TRINITY_DN1591_c0_g1~~TRINITY_DN1591_c0_g1_i3.p1  ORF type:complete len:751 (-),score=178.89 TRINITY_DN1591_c0_g1_i3:1041-3293(-)